MKLIDRYRMENPPSSGDRAMALVTASFLEQGLEEIISLATVKEYDDQALRREFFGGSVIGGFYGKIILGHALGAYTSAFMRDLHQVRHIRNTFAHAKDDISFQTKEISDACAFHTVDYFISADKPLRFEDARARYIFMVFFACTTFEIIVHDSGGERPESYEQDRILP